MDGIRERIRESARAVAARYKELSELLSYPEIAADTRLYLLYEREAAAIAEPAAVSMRYLAVLSDAERCGAELAAAREEEKAAMRGLFSELEEETERIGQELLGKLSEAGRAGQSAVIELCAESGAKSKRLFDDLCAAYRKYALVTGFSFSDEDGERTGDRRAIFSVEGFGAYSAFSSETGEHRALSETGDGCGAVTVAVFPETEKRSADIDIKDIRIDIFHSGGPGGQNVNKVETAVRLTHEPTGIVVVCRDERSQLKNKERAFSVLRGRLRERAESERRSAEAKERKNLSQMKNVRVRDYDYAKKTAFDVRTGVKMPLADFFSGNLEPFLSAAALFIQSGRKG